MKRTAFIAFVLVTMIYIFLGSLVFHFIEGSNEKNEKRSFVMDHQKFLDAHTCLTPEALHEYMVQVMDAYARGVSVISVSSHANVSNSSSSNSSKNGENEHEDETNWDLASTFLFCLTVVSTVGYGNLAPKTEGGQTFCILFALIGIPLFATSLVGVGERLQIPLKKIKKGRPWYKSDPKKDEQLKTAVFLSSGICLLIFIPAFVLSRTENWSYIEALYFCIITLTTIGFGDYIPDFDGGKSHDKLSFYLHRVILCIWILLGLSWVALIFSELASIMKEQIVEAARKTSNKFGNFEDMVKKKAKDARERIAQKDRDPDSNFGEEEFTDQNVYIIKNSSHLSPKHTQVKDNGIPGFYRSLTSVNSMKEDDPPGKNHTNTNCNQDLSENETLSRVDVR